MKIKFNRTYVINGKEVNELELDLDNLTGADLLRAEREFKTRNSGVNVKELEDSWMVQVAATASNVKYGDLLKLKGKDYLNVISKTRSFLFVTDSDATTEEVQTTQEEM